MMFRVRKYRAPNGALRQEDIEPGFLAFIGQKAPSAKRCIKTVSKKFLRAGLVASESTERQKVH